MWILNSFDEINIESILRWSTLRQMQSEGGFQGRTNKLVDSCYSFWQGSIPAVLLMGTNGRVGVQRVEAEVRGEDRGEDEKGEEDEEEEREEKQDDGRLMMDQRRLQEYILGCCQQTNGGLRDKPGKSRDNYHTCYSLSGLSVAQQFGGEGVVKAGTKEGEEEEEEDEEEEKKSVVVGSVLNLLEPTHPVYNVHREKVKRALEYFGALGCVHEELMNSSLDACVEVDDVEL